MQIPGSPDAGIAVDVATSSDAGTKATQQPAAPGVQRWRCGAEKENPNQVPSDARQAIAKGETRALKGSVVCEDHGKWQAGVCIREYLSTRSIALIKAK